MTRLYLRDTLITGTRYTLSETQGTGATLGSGNEGGSVFVEKLRFEIQVDDTVTGTSFPCSIDMSAVSASTLEWRWRVVKVDSSGNITAGSDYSSAFNTAGIKTATLTLSTTWAATDRLGVSLELRKTGGGGNRSFTLNVNDADSYTDATISVPVTGSIAQTLPGLSQSGSGSITVSGTASQTLPSLTQAGTGTLEVSGSGAQSLPSVTQSATGDVSSGVSGSISQTLAALTQTAAGEVEVSGTGSQSLPGLGQAATGSLEVAATGSQTLPALSQDGLAEVVIAGDGAQLLPLLSQNATGTVGDVVSGQIAQTLPALSQSGLGESAIGGDGASVLSALTQTAEGEIQVSGSGVQTLAALLNVLTGTVGDVTLGAPVEGRTKVIGPIILTHAIGPSGRTKARGG